VTARLRDHRNPYLCGKASLQPGGKDEGRKGFPN